MEHFKGQLAPTVLVTGANGFVGRAVCRALVARNMQVNAAVRNVDRVAAVIQERGVRTIAVGNIDGSTDWTATLAGCTSVIHLAARAHVMHEKDADPMAAFRQTNVQGTLHLARSAMRAGVRRFVFVSSVGVHGNQNGRAFTEADSMRPVEDYAVSKLEAEVALQLELAGSAMQLVIVRPPLVYGPGCPGNFLRLLKLLSSRVPLPFGKFDARRSFVGVWNLADFLVMCTLHERAAGEIFLVSDMEDVALPELMRGLAVGMERSAPIFSFSPAVLGLAAKTLGIGAMFHKLYGGLTVDATHAQRTLDWHPPVPLAEGLQRTGRWYAESLVGRSPC